MMILAGALSVIFGLILAFSPVTGALVVVWWIGMYAIAFGAMMLFLSFRLRKREAAGQMEGKWGTTQNGMA
jgi:uncharacterized membrane protein HdeD (DUF308 family)